MIEKGVLLGEAAYISNVPIVVVKAVPSYRARGAVAPPVSQAIVTTYPHCFVS